MAKAPNAFVDAWHDCALCATREAQLDLIACGVDDVVHNTPSEGALVLAASMAHVRCIARRGCHQRVAQPPGQGPVDSEKTCAGELSQPQDEDSEPQGDWSSPSPEARPPTSARRIDPRGCDAELGGWGRKWASALALGACAARGPGNGYRRSATERGPWRSRGPEVGWGAPRHLPPEMWPRRIRSCAGLGAARADAAEL